MEAPGYRRLGNNFDTARTGLHGDASRSWQACPVDTADRVDVDLLIIGAGPSGLFAGYYAGFRGFRTALLDSLPEAGGQITAMYPEN